MQFSLFSSVCEAGRRRLALWLAAGTSKAAACVNLFFLAAAWLILPLEKDPWKGILARFSRVLPDPAKGALLPLDACVSSLSLCGLPFSGSPRKERPGLLPG